MPTSGGGFIVASQRLSGAGELNAVQMALGLDQRDGPVALPTTATRVTDALVVHLEANSAL